MMGINRMKNNKVKKARVMLNLALSITLSCILLLVEMPFKAGAISTDQRRVYNSGTYYYDSSSTSTTGIGGCQTPGTQLPGNTIGEQVFNFFVTTGGFSNESAAAITGNLQVESADFTVIDGWGGGGGNYYGIAQWSRDDRYVKLVQFAGSTQNAAQLPYQLNFIMYELKNGYSSTLTYLQSPNYSVSEKAIYWGRNYEVAVNADGSLQAEAQRVADAQIWYQRATGNPAPPDTSPTGNCTGNGSGSGNGGGGGGGGTVDGCTNPFPGGWAPSRLDMGYDGTFSGQVAAPCAGTITYASDSFSNWGGWIEIKLDQKPSTLATSTIYFAEGISPIVRSGHVNAGDPIGNAVPNRNWNGIVGNIEWGVAQDGSVGTPTNTYVYGQCGSAGAAASVFAFVQWAESLGVAAPTSTDNAGCP